jgi:hypothetical protein
VLDFVRKLAAFILLLLIPLQGAATPMLSVLQCSPAAAGAAYSPNSDDEAAQKQGDVDGKAIHDPFFCHQSVSGIPVIPRLSAMSDLPVFVPSVSLLSSLFVPEQPQRPPFTADF